MDPVDPDPVDPDPDSDPDPQHCFLGKATNKLLLGEQNGEYD